MYLADCPAAAVSVAFGTHCILHANLAVTFTPQYASVLSSGEHGCTQTVKLNQCGIICPT